MHFVLQIAFIAREPDRLHEWPQTANKIIATDFTMMVLVW